MSLDKDCLVVGNKNYSPDTCLFIPQWLNAFVTESNKARGEFPLGVYFNKEKKKFVSQCNYKSSQIYLGQFDNPEDAHEAWREKKIEIVYEMKTELDEIHPNLFESLLNKYKRRLYS